MKAVGQFDNKHANVAGHCHDHLADGLSGGCVAVLDLVEFRHAVDEPGDLVTEFLTQRVDRVGRVFNRVVKQCSCQGRRRHAEVGEDSGNGNRVSDVRIATPTHLMLVILGRNLVRPDDHLTVGLRVELAQLPQQWFEFRISRPRSPRRANARRRNGVGLSGAPELVNS